MEPKFEHTENNHFKWGWGDEWYGTRIEGSPYKIHLGYTKRPLGTLREEVVRAAEIIANKATKPIIIGLSGGGDSQMTCLGFRDAKIPFTVVIARYKYFDGKVINLHDIECAYEFCKKFNIEYQEIEIDIDHFFKTRAIELCKKYIMPKTGTIIQTQVMDLVGKDHCYIMAGGDPVFHTMKSNKAPKYGLKTYMNGHSEPYWGESPVPIMQHMISNDYEGTSKFFMYTPELMARYLKDPIVTDFLNTADIILDAYSVVTKGAKTWRCFQTLFKPIMTYREFPEMIRTMKYTGYENMYAGAENIPARMSVYESMLAESLKDSGPKQEIFCPIEKLISYLTTEHDEKTVLSSQNDLDELRG
jgi:hypothetical protein